MESLSTTRTSACGAPSSAAGSAARHAPSTAALPCAARSWYPYASSLTVTFTPYGFSFALYAVTCAASVFAGRTSSKSGSEPNWTRRVTKGAFGFVEREV